MIRPALRTSSGEEVSRAALSVGPQAPDNVDLRPASTCSICGTKAGNNALASLTRVSNAAIVVVYRCSAAFTSSALVATDQLIDGALHADYLTVQPRQLEKPSVFRQRLPVAIGDVVDLIPPNNVPPMAHAPSIKIKKPILKMIGTFLNDMDFPFASGK